MSSFPKWQPPIALFRRDRLASTAASWLRAAQSRHSAIRPVLIRAWRMVAFPLTMKAIDRQNSRQGFGVSHGETLDPASRALAKGRLAETLWR
jgi:hypothetical protein